MNIAWLQYDIVWQDTLANLEILDRLIASSEESWDLLFLPEMFDTGFSMDPSNILERDTELVIKWMKQIASTYDCAVGGSVIMRLESGSFVNRFVYIDTEQEAHYDKVHLFSLSGEHKSYQAGKRSISIQHSSGLNIRPLICYDLRFPSISIHRGEIDLIVYVANWPEGRINQWEALLRARAIENQSFVLGVNRIGIDGNGYNYNGMSTIFSYDGKRLQNSKEKQGVFIQKIDLAAMKKYREKLPFLEDRKLPHSNFE